MSHRKERAFWKGFSNAIQAQRDPVLHPKQSPGKAKAVPSQVLRGISPFRPSPSPFSVPSTHTRRWLQRKLLQLQAMEPSALSNYLIFIG